MNNVLQQPDFHASWASSSANDFLGAQPPGITRISSAAASSSSTSSSTNKSNHQSTSLTTGRSDMLLGSVQAHSRSVSMGEYYDISNHASFSNEMISGISSAIHDAARITNWETVKELCASNPEAAKYTGRDGWTALHHACNRRCGDIEAVEALIRAYPDALTKEAENSWTPLHYACRFKMQSAAVRLLVHMYPDKGHETVSRCDRQGRTPLYYAVRYDAPAGVVGILLGVDASAVLEEDQNADSPLALVWDQWAEKMEGRRTLQKLYAFEKSETMDRQERSQIIRKRLETQSKLCAKWERVNMFLKAAFGFSVDDDEEINGSNGTSNCKESSHLTSDEKKESSSTSSCASQKRKWRVLHATAAIRCHPSLFLLAEALHPEQAFEIDNHDLHPPSHLGLGSASHLTALHIAASSRGNGEAGKMVINRLITSNPSAATTADSDGCLPLHRIAMNKYRPGWEVDGTLQLLNCHQEATTIPDLHGQMPLHRACATFASMGKDDSGGRFMILNFLFANMAATQHADDSGRLPFHILAQHATMLTKQVEAVFDANPNAVRARTGSSLKNRLPLHLAAANEDALPCLLKYIVEANPMAASQYDQAGKLPLHLACEAGLSQESVAVLIEAFPVAIEEPEQNARGWNALQMAVGCSSASGELISYLLELHPANASIADDRGRYAFHLACLGRKSWEGGLKALFQANPDALRTPDKVGLIPFFIAAFQHCARPVDTTQKRPKVFDATNRRVSLVVTEQRKQIDKKKMDDMKGMDVLFELLRADPSVIN